VHAREWTVALVYGRQGAPDVTQLRSLYWSPMRGGEPRDKAEFVERRADLGEAGSRAKNKEPIGEGHVRDDRMFRYLFVPLAAQAFNPQHLDLAFMVAPA
jgi:hypothetical protein